MRRLTENIKYISENCRNTAVMFSGGRDSIVMLNLFMEYAPESIGNVIFMYFCPNLRFEERILKYYEKRYRIKIDRIAHPDAQDLIISRNKKKRIRMSDMEKYIRSEFSSDWIAYGFRKDESLQRRGQLAHIDSGIDWKFRKVFPVAEWSAKHMTAWIQRNKLILPPEYKFGFRDINSFKGETLEYIYNNYPDDYEKIKAFYPDVEGELLRYRGSK